MATLSGKNVTVYIHQDGGLTELPGVEGFTLIQKHNVEQVYSEDGSLAGTYESGPLEQTIELNLKSPVEKNYYYPKVPVSSGWSFSTSTSLPSGGIPPKTHVAGHSGAIFKDAQEEQKFLSDMEIGFSEYDKKYSPSASSVSGGIPPSADTLPWHKKLSTSECKKLAESIPWEEPGLIQHTGRLNVGCYITHNELKLEEVLPVCLEKAEKDLAYGIMQAVSDGREYGIYRESLKKDASDTNGITYSLRATIWLRNWKDAVIGEVCEVPYGGEDYPHVKEYVDGSNWMYHIYEKTHLSRYAAGQQYLYRRLQ
jgi:hypothetical protein